MKYQTILFLLVLIVIGYRVYTNRAPNSKPLSIQPSITASSSVLGAQTNSSGCVGQSGLPDKSCTPGAIFPSATKEQICIPGYSKAVRNVPTAEKEQVFAEYGVTHHIKGEYEVDHLISLELGGSNDIANLWPEPAEPRPGFHEKDMVENYLHDKVCSGAISLSTAQSQIATNWLDVYNQIPH